MLGSDHEAALSCFSPLCVSSDTEEKTDLVPATTRLPCSLTAWYCAGLSYMRLGYNNSKYGTWHGGDGSTHDVW